MQQPGTALQAHNVESLNYESLPFNTHPIDIAHGSQGWGPMNGPYTPLDFMAPAMAGFGGQGINIYWTQGNNQAVTAPAVPYGISTVFMDPATALVNNSHYNTPLFGGQQNNTSSATIAQGPKQMQPTPVGKGQLLLSAIRATLGIN